MKRTVSFLLAVLWLCTCGLPVFAQEAKYKTAGDYYDSWDGSRPDFITCVISADGGATNLILGLQDNEAGRAAEKEILALIEDDSTVSFIYQTYSYNELDEIFQEMLKYFEMEMGLMILSVDGSENCVAMKLLDEKQNDPHTLELIRQIKERYADAVSIRWITRDQVPVPCDQEESTPEPTVSTEPTQPKPTQPKPSEPKEPPRNTEPAVSTLPYLLIAAALMIIVLTLFAMGLRKRNASEKE